MSGMELFVVLLLGIALGWLGAWYVQRQPEMKERVRTQQLESELNACRQQLAQAQVQPTRTGAVTLTPEAAATATPTPPAEFGAPAARYTPPAVAVSPTPAAAVEVPRPAPVASAGVATAASELAAYRAEIAPAPDTAAAPAAPAAEPVGEAATDAIVEPAAIAKPAAEEKAATVMAEAVAEKPDGKIGEKVMEAEPAPAARAAEVSLAVSASAGSDGDDLTRIKGIGKKFAAALSAGGVRTYAELAAATPEQLHGIVQPQAWQKVDYAPWIEQAQTLARQRRRSHVGDDLTRLEGIGPAYAERLRAGNITTYAQLAATGEARLAELIGAKPWQRVAYADWTAQAKLAAAGDEEGLAALQAELNRRQGDNLTLIRGLGEQSATALQAAGISTYAALAAATPEQVNTALGVAGVRRGNAAAWIEEAQRRAAGERVSRGGVTRRRPANGMLFAYPQDLAEVHGIGQVYEQRLYNAGIGSFWELGMIPAPELAEILAVRDFQDVDLAAIQAEAMALAASTNTLGRIWDGTEPDDLEAIEGIGPVFEQRLYAAGIGTYAELAATSVGRLAELCPPRVGRIDYAAWIEQARIRARG